MLRPNARRDGRTMHVNCGFQLVADRVDPLQEQFLHGSGIGHESLSDSGFT